MDKSPKEKNNQNYNVVIVGRPNVGKSSLFNRIIGMRKAVVLDEPRTTRDIIEEQIEIDGHTLNLIDTAGHFKGKGDEIENKSIEKIYEALNLADRLIFVVDSEVPPSEEDKIIADRIRKSGKDIILVINKMDSTKKKNYAEDYLKIGFRPYFSVSTIHNLGISELLAETVKKAPKAPVTIDDSVHKTTRVTILGRPNVGKSSILNAICGKNKAIVSGISGTTRDVISEKIFLNDFEVELSDTAGARRPGKIGKAYIKGQPIEKFAYIRTEKTIARSDIILLVLDASEKRATTQDLHIAGLAKEAGKGIILVINKWDLVDKITQEKFLHRLRSRFSFMTWVPAIFVSAETGLNIDKIGEIIKTVAENQNRRIATSKLNRIIEDFILDNLPKGRGKIRPKVFFAAQTDV
ncbi:ribosome biogenesis GTPase Der, partial [Patescibacteria group bacterium]|nr:ribosome biogenesis GTPase Der [Patescibacteria group bacterium]